MRKGLYKGKNKECLWNYSIRNWWKGFFYGENQKYFWFANISE